MQLFLLELWSNCTNTKTIKQWRTSSKLGFFHGIEGAVRSLTLEYNNITLNINYVPPECRQAYLTLYEEISVGSNQAFGRGLFAVDPETAEREASKKNAYKEELRLQMEEQTRRKQEEKRKLREEDERLEKKFYADLDKEASKKNEKQPPKNDKNIPPPPQKSQMITSELFREDPQPPKREDFEFKPSLRANTEEDRSRNPYLRQPNLYQMQEDQFFDETNAQRLRAMKELL